MDKMPVGLIDVLEPLVLIGLNYYPPYVGKIDYRQSIFDSLAIRGVILSTILHCHAGKTERNEKTSLKIKEMDRPLTLREFNNKGGFWHSSLIDKSLKYYLFPFLSMERSHVKKCAKAELCFTYLSISEKGNEHPVLSKHPPLGNQK